MFNPTRDQVREFFFGVWAKSRAGEALTPLESMALAVVLEHPEYHEVLGDRERYRERDVDARGRRDQSLPAPVRCTSRSRSSSRSTSRPASAPIVAALARKLDSPMAARHAVMDCLAEQVWQAQRNGVAFDNAAYLDCLRAAQESKEARRHGHGETF